MHLRPFQTVPQTPGTTLEAIAIRLEAIASRLEAIALRLEAIAISLKLQLPSLISPLSELALSHVHHELARCRTGTRCSLAHPQKLGSVGTKSILGLHGEDTGAK